jgi:small-conductance mechanosensitive channel
MGIWPCFFALAVVTALPAFPARGADPAPPPPGAFPEDGDVGETAEDAITPARPVPVELDGRVLFYMRASVGDRSAADRARAVESRIQEIARAKEKPDPLRVVEGHHSDIFCGTRFIASITTAESGRPENRAFYAAAVARRIDEGIARHRAERTPDAVLSAVLRSLAATGVFLAFLVGMRLARRRVAPHLARAAESLLSRMRIQGQALLDAEATGRFVRVAGGALRVAVFLVALLAWAEVVLRLLPWTRGPADRALRFSLAAAGSVLSGVLGYLPNLVYIALFVLVGWGAQALNRLFFRAVRVGAVSIPGFYPDWAATTSRLVSVLVIALVAVAIYPYLPGSGSSAFQAIGLLLGAMISLGSGSAVANAISGIVLTYMRPFTVGDFVRIADATGTVTQQSMLSVRLVTIRNETVTLPASTVLSGQVLNYSSKARQEGVAIHTGVTIGYDTPWRKVHEMLLEAARKTPGVRAEPPPWVIQKELSDFYVSYELDAYVETPDRQHFVLSDLNQNVQDVFFANGVEILSPHYAQLRDGSRPAIPPDRVPPGSVPQPFPVELRKKDGG